MPEKFALWYVWTYESRSSEKARSRYHFVARSRYPTNRFWVEDMVKDVAKTGKFRYAIKTDRFFVVMFMTENIKRYGMGDLSAHFKIRIKSPEMADYEVTIEAASFLGPDARIANYEWRYGRDPYKVQRAPTLVPGTPDPSRSSMFGGGGMIHHQYPRVMHSSYARQRLSSHHYPATSGRWYAHLEARRLGLPSALPSFSTADKEKARRAAKAGKEDPSY